MADDEEGVDEFEGQYVPSYPWNRDHVTVDALDFAASIAESAAAYLRQLTLRAGASSNHGIDQAEMRQEAAKEIESLIEQPEE